MSEQATGEWLKTLPEELQKDPVIQNFKSPADLATAYREAKVQISRKGVILPPEGSDDKAWEPVFEALGRPKEAKDYELPVAPAGVKLDQTLIDEFRGMAHKLGMNKKQFKEAFGAQINKIVKEQTAATEAATKRKNEAETMLRQKFGSKYNEVVQGVQKLVNGYADKDDAEVVDLLNSNPAAIAFLSKILGDMSEATLEKLGHVKGGELTPDEAKDEITKIRTDKDHPLNAAFNNPNMGQKHLEAKKRVDALYAQAYPDKKKI
jgi:hypothetical protein